jgi:squalene-hopene/tetraprenyl-beta-curcumene cyclase
MTSPPHARVLRSRRTDFDPELRKDLDQGIASAREHLLGLQREDGHWCSWIETDASVTAETLLLCRHVGRVDAERERKMVNYLSARQQPDGGWQIHESGPFSQETTIKCYAALKASGIPESDERLQRAKAIILDHGGVETSAVFTKIWLALCGQMSWDAVPAVPPEIMLLPRTAPFNIHEISYWCRCILVTLSIIQSVAKPGHIPEENHCPELFRSLRSRVKSTIDGGNDLISWKRFFYLADRALKGLEPMSKPLMRKRALKAAETWCLDHLPDSEGLGAIIPGMQNMVLVFWSLDYPDDDPRVEKAWTDFWGLGVEDGDEFWMQPCLSPVWDTGLSAAALEASGSERGEDHLIRAADWLLDHRTTRRGDWEVKVKGEVEAGAWAFQYANDFFPDVDDTAVVLMALRQSGATDQPALDRASEVGLKWLRAMQSRNGGWGAYDRNNDRDFLNHVPFADHGALLDAPTSDLTGRLLQCFGEHGSDRDDPVVKKAIAFLRREQEPEGCWFGRWGINYLYGTWSALEGLEAVGVPTDDPMMVNAADWIESVQNPDGGWGETPDSYADRRLMARGVSTPSQTAWALISLICTGRAHSGSARRAAEYLLRTQRDDGNWDETEWTGTGFARVLYLRYHQYRLNFPLLALGKLRTALGT